MEPTPPADKHLDFLMTPWSQSLKGLWLIFRQHISPSNCVAVCASRQEALEKAIAMAQYQVSTGRSSQIHCRENERSAWRTVWCRLVSQPGFRRMLL